VEGHEEFQKVKKTAEGEIPSKNKILDAKVTEDLERAETVEEGKQKLEWVEEWIVVEDRWR
jgi:hypothetical protein